MFIFFFSKAIQYTHSFILECYTPLLLYTSTHILILMQTIHLFQCNLCLLFMLLYCELYASTLLCYFSMRIHLYAFTILVLWCSLYACTVLRYSFSTPVHLYTFTPVHLYASTLVRHSLTVHFSVHFFCCTFYYSRGVEA